MAKKKVGEETDEEEEKVRKKKTHYPGMPYSQFFNLTFLHFTVGSSAFTLIDVTIF